MQSRAKGPTKAERARMARIAELGCVACRSDGKGRNRRHGEIHHLLDGGVRRGHLFTIGLCTWHHRGCVDEKVSFKAMPDLHGPSLFHDARAFRERYGSDDELLAYQDKLLATA